ncbi:non-heme chloroperoxidase [Actinoplanes tereljensis]|uniref:Alpha/beta hydrolase n=1 Tax=Paractinoplanes tereljensis TaxID=571912 RepID=A0A919NSR8_9ACTN|nr:alpha/beta hydrolase [Actinoplanes tereljensis]GIF23294.1 alpha/beta hydrolase [Actinoplanes tereljensis]
MPFISTRDNAEIFYKDWGDGRPVVFCHGWPLNADIWDNQLQLVASHGYRGIAHDRRGHGRSSQTWQGNTMDTYADDLADLIDTLDLSDVVLVGHSTGGGEVTHYLGRYGTGRVAKVVLRGAVVPHLLGTADDPGGAPIEVFDQLRAGLADRSQFYRQLAEPFYGNNRPGADVSQGVRDAFWLISMTVGLKAAYDCIAAFSETNMTADLRSIDVPVLLSHGDDDQIVPIQASSERSIKLLPNATLNVHPGAPHGLVGRFEQDFNAELLDFIKS